MFQRLTPMVKNLLIITVAAYFIPSLLGLNLGLYHLESDNFMPYQLFTYMFAHAGFMHILFNMMGLMFLGPLLEQFWGPKKFLTFNTEFTDRPICTASTQYIKLKLDEIKKENLSENTFEVKYEKLTEKECLCNGLANSSLLVNDLDVKMEGLAVSVCPGPNIAYFSGKFSLKEMVDHIYGRINILNTEYRPNFFIKELKMYIDYLKDMFSEITGPISDKQIKYFDTFTKNITDGIEYYKTLFEENKTKLKDVYESAIQDLEKLEMELNNFALVKI